MAHHNNTPKSVLDAPKRSFGFVSEQPYANRATRRHARTKDGAVVNIPKTKQAPALNTPYRSHKNG